MSGGRLDFEELNRTNRMRLNGYEGVDDPKGPENQPKTRPEERVTGVLKSARARTKEDHELLAKLERRLELWTNASDVSSVELDKLHRQIKHLAASLPPVKKRPHKLTAKRGKKKKTRL